MPSKYNVVLEYTSKAGGYEGNRIWSTFNSKEEFCDWYADDQKVMQKVVAEGVSEARAIELCRQVSGLARLAAAVEASTRPGDEKSDPALLSMELAKIAFARFA